MVDRRRHELNARQVVHLNAACRSHRSLQKYNAFNLQFVPVRHEIVPYRAVDAVFSAG